MTPQEKAKEIYEKHYYSDFFDDDISCKNHSLVTVDEMIKFLVDLSDGNFTFIYNVEYWKEVSKEIEKL